MMTLSMIVLYLEVTSAHPIPESDRIWDWLNENITEEDCKNVF